MWYQRWGSIFTRLFVHPVPRSPPGAYSFPLRRSPCRKTCPRPTHPDPPAINGHAMSPDCEGHIILHLSSSKTYLLHVDYRYRATDEPIFYTCQVSYCVLLLRVTCRGKLYGYGPKYGQPSTVVIMYFPCHLTRSRMWSCLLQASLIPGLGLYVSPST